MEAREVALWGVVWIVLAFAGPGKAKADEDPEALIRQGVSLRKSGDDAKAHGYFRRAYDIAHTPRSAAQLGLVEYALMFWGISEAHLFEALGSDSDAWIRANHPVLEQALTDVRTHLCELKITGDPPGARILVSGQFKGNLPVSIYAPAGPVSIDVQAPDFQSSHQTVTMVTGAAGKLAVHLSPKATAAVASPEATEQDEANPRNGGPAQTTENKPQWKRPVAWMSGGVGLALLGGGIAAALASNGNYQSFNTPKIAGSNENRCSTALADKGGSDCAGFLSAGDRDKALAIGAFIGAAAFIATSTVLFVTSFDKHADIQTAMECAPIIDRFPGGSCALRF
ncbi:MAG TPA: PEGA domain-containing protein [Polyangia bacterium]|jgi:hypothetical protein|nr:PEGA domain-containing protein [Polyangia bacterium]